MEHVDVVNREDGSAGVSLGGPDNDAESIRKGMEYIRGCELEVHAARK